MRDLFLISVGIIIGISIDRLAGDWVGLQINKGAAAIEAFQSTK